MLETLEQVEWANLEHAYGKAGDLPENIRALTSDDPQERAWAQDMLEMGPFHQGSIYSSTPYVARFLIELIRQEAIAGKEWMFSYLSRLMDTALRILAFPKVQADDDEYDEFAGKTLGELREEEKDFARQIKAEIQPHLDLFFAGLNSAEARMRLSVIRTLLTLHAEDVSVRDVLTQQFVVEQDEMVRAALAFCIGATSDAEEQTSIRAILEDEQETPMVRLAAGFGWIGAVQQAMPDDALEQFAGLIEGNRQALNRLDSLHQAWLESPRFPDLLGILPELSNEHKLRLVPPLLGIFHQLPLAKDSTIRIGEGYYFATLILLAFPDGILSADATIHDLNETQRTVLRAFQTYRMPGISQRNAWNHYHIPTDFRYMLGLEIESETDFLDFMAGKRTARVAGSSFDQGVVRLWQREERRVR